MRVCLVSRELSPLTGGGIGVYVGEMARALVSAGHDVHILTEAHPGLQRLGGAACPGVRLHAADPTKGAAGLEAYSVFAMRHSMAVLEALRRLHAAAPLDYIEFPDYHAEGYFAIEARRTLGDFAGAVLAVRLHSPLGLCRRADEQWTLDREAAFTEHMELSAISRADVVVSPGRRVLAEVLEAVREAGLTPPRRAEVVALPVNVERLHEHLGRGRGGAAPGPPEVLNFGRLQHLKGVHILVQAAMAMLDGGSGAKFRFIGTDTPTGPFGRSMLSYLRSRIPARWTDRIVFESGRPRAELGDAIRGASVCCFPSLWDAFPMACLEAMALGAPVVASDAGGLGEIIVDGQCGLLVPPGDSGALAAGLTRMLDDGGLRARLGAAGAARVGALCHPSEAVRALEALVASSRKPAAVHRPAATARDGVSIVIPFYNLARYLPETLESVRRQSLAATEVLIVDDGSTEQGSPELLARLESQGCRVIRKPNGGLGSARNTGLREARGRWVLPLDADDVLAPEFLERTAGAALADPGVSVVSTLVSYFIDDPGAVIGGWVPLGLDRDLLSVFNVGAAAGSLIDRRAALDAGGYDERLTSYEDWDFWCRLAERGLRAAVVPEFLFHYRVRADSMFRTEAVSRDAELRAYLLRQHPDLPRRPERVMRMLLGTAQGPEAVEARARAISQENLRYRIADRLNTALKVMRLQTAIKTVAGGLTGRGNSRNGR